MTQEEKELLVADLCARLPFQVKVAIDFKGYLEVLPDDENLQYNYRKNLKLILDFADKTIEDISKEPNILYAYPCTERFEMLRGYTYELDYGVPVEFIKPYLRPISSMTREEKRCLNNIAFEFGEKFLEPEADAISRWNATAEIHARSMDYLNSIHVDCRNLIPMGLALEAPEDMYK